MKLKLNTIIFSLIIMLIPFYNTFAAESSFEGEVSAQGQLVHVNGSEAKFDEYADTKDGVYGAADLKYNSESYFMRLNAEDIGYDTQKYSLDGGMWGKFKYDLYYNEIPHNMTFGAKSFFSGIGGSDLTGAPTPVSSWHKFDYETERKRFGGGISLDLLSPFFLDISAQTEKKEGIKPAGADGGSTLLFTELPEPVDYRTDSFHVEGGYSKRPFFASLSYDFSKFDNDDQALDFANPFTLAGDSVTLPPENKYYKLGFKGAIFLMYNTKISVNASSARATSDTDSNSILLTNSFKGKVDTKNLNAVLTSNPVKFLDAKLFYKYYDRANE